MSILYGCAGILHIGYDNGVCSRFVGVCLVLVFYLSVALLVCFVVVRCSVRFSVGVLCVDLLVFVVVLYLSVFVL